MEVVSLAGTQRPSHADRTPTGCRKMRVFDDDTSALNDSTTVVVLTGSGLKDPDAALGNVEPPTELDGDARALAKVLKL